MDFNKDYDHIGYSRQALLNDIDQIVIKKTTLGDANKPYCKMGDWAVVHYKAFVEGKLTENSRTYEKGYPRVFRLGYFEASKCWDIAL